MISLALPDEPRWVDAHGIAAEPTSWQLGLGAGGAVGNDDAQLVVVYGDADPAAVASLAHARAAHAMLVATEELASALRAAGRLVGRAVLHTLPDPDALPGDEGATRLPAEAEVPEVYAREITGARSRRSVWTVHVDGAPVAFAYAPWRSARWFGVSVDTLPRFRQLGLGTIVAAAMIRDERGAGREPVWAADEGNVASLRLAERLGFFPIDELWIAPPR